MSRTTCGVEQCSRDAISTVLEEASDSNGEDELALCNRHHLWYRIEEPVGGIFVGIVALSTLFGLPELVPGPDIPVGAAGFFVGIVCGIVSWALLSTGIEMRL